MKLLSLGKILVVLAPLFLSACGGGSSSTPAVVINPTEGTSAGLANDPETGSDSSNETTNGLTNSDAGTATAGAGTTTTGSDSGSSDAGSNSTGGQTAGSPIGSSASAENSTAPDILSFSVTTRPAFSEEPVSFSWVLGSTSDTSLTCLLDIDLDGSIDYRLENCSNIGSLVHTFSLPGEYSAQLEVIATNGDKNSSTINVVIEPANTPPVINSVTVAPAPVMVNDKVTIAWDVEDIDGDALVCSVDADGDGIEDYSISDCTGANSVEHLYGNPGDYIPTLSVSDPFAGMDTKEAEVNVLPILVRINAPSVVAAGSRAKFEIQVSNLSQTPVNNVRVFHRLPVGLSYFYNSDNNPDSKGCGTCTADSESHWTYTSLLPGQNAFITINALVSQDLAPDTIITAPFTISGDGMQSQITLAKDVRINNKLTTQIALATESMTVVAGETFDLTVTLGNVDNKDLSDATARLVIPPDTVAEEILGADGIIEEASGDVVWSLGTLPVVESLQRTIRLRVAQDAPTGLILPFHASIKHSGDAELGRTTEFSIPVTEQKPPLNLSFSIAQNPVVAGTRLQTQITISNSSLVPIRNIQLMHRLPDGLNYLYNADSFPDSAGCGTCDSGDESYWGISVLAAGESRTFNLNAQVGSLLQGGTIITLPFTIHGSTVSTTMNKRLVARIDNRTRVEMSTSVSTNPVAPGEEVTAHVDVGNIHSKNLQGGNLQLLAPAGFSLVSVDTEGGTVDAENGAISWNSLSLDVASAKRYTVRMVANTDVIPGDIEKFAAILDFPDTIQIDATSAAPIAVVEELPSLQLDVMTVEPSAEPGKRLRYVFTLSNNGLIPINDLFLQLRVPEGLSYFYNSDASPDSAGCGTCTSGNESYWRITSLASGASQSIELNANVLSTLPRGSLISTPISLIASGVPFTQFRTLTVPVK